MKSIPARRTRLAKTPVRTALVAVVAAAIILITAGCSRPNPAGSPPTGASTSVPSKLADSQCMRANGVPKFPDPNSDGALPKIDVQQLGVSNSQYQAAETGCEHLLPGGGTTLNDASATQCLSTGDCSPGLKQKLMDGMLQFSQCMRSHGVPNWPDPTVDSEGRPGIDLVAVPGTDWSSARIEDKLADCQKLLPGVRVGLERP